MIESPRLSLESYHCPNCAAPLSSSYCRYCGATITSYLLNEKIKWPEERDLAIDLSLVALFDRLGAEAGLETLSVFGDDTLVLKVRRNSTRNWHSIATISTYNQDGSPIFSGEAPLVYTLQYQNNRPGWQGRLRISFGKKVGRQAKIYFVRYHSGMGLDHHPEILTGELELANSRRLTSVFKSIFAKLI